MNGADPLPRRAGIAVLRRLEVSDLAVFQDYRHDPRITLYQDWYGTRTDAEASAFLAKMNAQELLQPGICSQIGIAEPAQLALLGDIGLTLAEDGKSAEIGYSLRPAAQGRGMATAAIREVINLVFELTDAEEVRAIIDPLNVRSRRVLERVGMRMVESRDGTFRDAPSIDHLYAISRPRQEPSRMQVLGPDLHRQSDCEAILRSLPAWFGIEEALVMYVRDSAAMPTFAVDDGARLLAFLTLKKHFPEAWEIHCVAVHADARNRGFGTRLLDHAEAWLAQRGVRFLQVKTIADTSSSASYAETREFYARRGFKPLEVFPTLWHVRNPALQLIKVLQPG